MLTRPISTPCQPRSLLFQHCAEDQCFAKQYFFVLEATPVNWVHIRSWCHLFPILPHTPRNLFCSLLQPGSSPTSSVTPSGRSLLQNAKTGSECFSSLHPLHKHPYPRLSLTVERLFPSHLLLVLVLTADPPTNSLHTPGSSNFPELTPSCHSEGSRKRI